MPCITWEAPPPGDTPKSTIPNDAKVFFIAQPVNKWVLKLIALPSTASRKLGDLMLRESSRVMVAPEAWLSHTSSHCLEWLDI